MKHFSPLTLLISCIFVGAMTFIITFHKQDKIVINMPADARPLEQLTQPGDKIVGPDRAVLWWTVYSKTLSMSGSYLAVNAADAAVDKVYSTK